MLRDEESSCVHVRARLLPLWQLLGMCLFLNRHMCHALLNAALYVVGAAGEPRRVIIEEPQSASSSSSPLPPHLLPPPPPVRYECPRYGIAIHCPQRDPLDDEGNYVPEREMCMCTCRHLGGPSLRLTAIHVALVALCVYASIVLAIVSVLYLSIDVVSNSASDAPHHHNNNTILRDYMSS